MLGDAIFKEVFSFADIGRVTVGRGTGDAVYDMGTVFKRNGIFYTCVEVGKFVVGFESNSQIGN